MPEREGQGRAGPCIVSLRDSGNTGLVQGFLAVCRVQVVKTSCCYGCDDCLADKAIRPSGGGSSQSGGEYVTLQPPDLKGSVGLCHVHHKSQEPHVIDHTF